MSRRDELRSEDAAARRRVQTAFDRPVVLTAGAGTGKTATLVARVVAWCVGAGWDRACARSPEAGARRVAVDVMSRIVAITFTEAAAAEMSSRILEALVGLLRDERPIGLLEEALPPDAVERRRRANALIDAFDHLTVRTIHAFCRRLLSRFPLEAGLHPGFDVDADERLQDEVVREVVEAALRDGYREGSGSPLLALAGQGHGPPAVEEALGEFVRAGVAAAELARDSLAPDDVARHLAVLREQTEALLGEAEPLSSVGGNTKAAIEAVRHSLALVAEALPGNVAAIAAFCEALRETWPDKARKRLTEWSKERFNQGETRALGPASERFAQRAAGLQPALRSFLQLEPERLGLAREALAPLLARAHDELRVRGAASYASLLVGARDLLASRRDIRAQVRRELEQLLVDEFQDTDATQCQLVRLLALEGPVAERPGLFLVGDPKQSIYGWRSADLRAYDEFVDEVVAAGGEHHSLCVNFRSVPAILDEVERVIEPVMNEEHGLQPAFQPLLPDPAREGEAGFEGGDAAPVEYWVSWRYDAEHGGPAATTRADEATDIEARGLARDLRALHDEQGVAWSDVALLLRGAGDLDDYLAALRERAVPYAVERDRSYYRRREVIEAAAWIRCVLDPGDHLALLTVLRSSAVGVPDVALIPLWARKLPQHASLLREAGDASLAAAREAVAAAAAAMPRDIPGLDRVEGWQENLVAALEALAALRGSFASDPADVFVEKLRELSAIELAEAARHLGAYRAANLERLFRELSRELCEGGDVESVLRRLRIDVERARDAEEERPKAAVEDAVQVMTIHKAKGLDFEHVYLLQLHKRAAAGMLPGAEVASGGDRLEYRVFGVATLGFETVRHGRAAVEAAERVRTLYVAMTRAKRRLVLMGGWPLTPRRIAAESAKSHVELLGSRAELPTGLPNQMALLASERQARWVDTAHARWVFPALEPSGGGVQTNLFDFAEGRARADVFASPDEVGAQSARLAGLRERAAQRMARRRGGAAGEASHALLREQLAERRYAAPGSAELGPVEVDGPGVGHWAGAAGGSDRAPSQDPAPAAISPAGASRRPREGGLAGRPGRQEAAEPAPQQVAMAAGTAVHRVLEDLAFDSGGGAPEAARELARRAQGLGAILEPLIPPAGREAALERARVLLGRFEAGPLFPRLCRLAPHRVARELPILLPAPDGDGDGSAPLDFVAGAVDLVYRDPADGCLVVVDYKTDQVADAEELRARAQLYGPQGRAYASALQGGLGLADPPRVELWFLYAGEVVQVAT